jgi:ArsR family transcriptional regulator, zinc-responsive transcriptional repressor
MKSRSPRCPGVIPPALLEDMAETLKVLAHPGRLRIVELLEVRQDVPVYVITEALGIPQASVSTHLNKMRRAGLIRATRKSREIWYTLANPHALTILNCIRSKI